MPDNIHASETSILPLVQPQRIDSDSDEHDETEALLVGKHNQSVIENMFVDNDNIENHQTQFNNDKIKNNEFNENTPEPIKITNTNQKNQTQKQKQKRKNSNDRKDSKDSQDDSKDDNKDSHKNPFMDDFENARSKSTKSMPENNPFLQNNNESHESQQTDFTKEENSAESNAVPVTHGKIG